MAGNILVYAEHDGNLAAIIRQLLQRSHCVIANESAYAESGSHLEGIWDWERFIPPNAAMIADRETNRILTALASGFQIPQVVQAFASESGNVLAYCGEPFFAKAKNLMTDEICAALTLEAIQRDKPLSLIIVPSEKGHRVRALLRMAQRLGIQTLLIDNFDYLDANNWPVSQPVLCDDVATIAGEMTERLLDAGYQPGHIHQTGLPPLLSPGLRISRLEARRQLKLAENQRLVLSLPGTLDFGSPSFPAMLQRLFNYNKAVLAAVQAQSDCTLFVKPSDKELMNNAAAGHRAEKQHYLNWAKTRGVAVAELLDKVTLEHLMAAELVVSYGTNPLLAKCLALQATVVIVDGDISQKWLASHSNAIWLEDTKELSATVTNLLRRNSENGCMQDKAPTLFSEGHNQQAVEKIADLAVALSNKPLQPQHTAEQTGIANPIINQLYEIIASGAFHNV